MTWTAADAAEQDALINELVRCFFEHRDTCDHCLAWKAKLPGSLPCPDLHTAIEIVLEWRRHRELLSRAEALRLQQNAAA